MPGSFTTPPTRLRRLVGARIRPVLALVLLAGMALVEAAGKRWA